MPLPTFEKLGVKLDRPSWLSSLSLQMMFPRVFANDAVRASLPGLPASAYSLLYSSDHGTTTGYIGRADFDDIEGTWTDSGSHVHSGANQRETPHPVYDPTSNRVNVYVHDKASGVADGSQAARLLTTTDLATFTDQGEVHPTGYHTGYGFYEYRDGAWRSFHKLTGNESNLWRVSTSADGETFTGSTLWHPGQTHVFGQGNMLCNPVPVLYEGQWYVVGFLMARPIMGNLNGEGISIVGVPVTADWQRITGPYQTLVECGGSGDDDERLEPNPITPVVIDGTLYIIYVGYDGSVQRFMLAQADGGTATTSTLAWPVRSDGTLSGGSKATTLLDWDAASDDIPATFQLVVRSGTSTSQHVAGSYYELKTGNSSQSDVYVRTADTFDPTAYETLEYTVEGLEFAEVSATGTEIFMGWTDVFATPTNRVTFLWSGLNTTRPYGSLLQRIGGTTNVEARADIYPWCDGSRSKDTGPTIHEWARGNPVTIAIRLHDYGKRVSVIVDGQIAYHRDVEADGQAWSTEPFAFLRINHNGNDGTPTHYARFTRFTVTAYQPGGGLLKCLVCGKWATN